MKDKDIVPLGTEWFLPGKLAHGVMPTETAHASEFNSFAKKDPSSMLQSDHVRFSILLLAAILFVGCTDPSGDGQSQTQNGPWIQVDEDKSGANGTLSVENGIGFFARNDDFRSLLELIASDLEITIIVEPKSLLNRGITIEVKGDNAEGMFSNLAESCELEISRTAEKEWLIKDAKSSDGTRGKIGPNDW